MKINMEDASKIKNLMTKHDIASSKQKFESDDSQGSDLSYESSITDDEEGNAGRIQFFKEQMARFFINYPELVNKNLLHNPDQDSEVEEENIKDKVNKNWESIADQIFNEAKDSSTSLSALAKRISLYRYKVEQEDLIDLLLQQKNNILKEIELQMAHKKSENSLMGQNQKQVNNQNQNTKEDNMYYSWRKRKEFQFKNNANINKPTRQKSFNKDKNIENNTQNTKIVKKFHRSLHKSSSQTTFSSKHIKGRGLTSTVKEKQAPGLRQTRKKTLLLSNKGEQQRHMDESHVINQNGERLNANWRHLVNFEPQTEIGKQLCQDIKKKNTPNDELGIKKTIIEFLVNYKELINNEVINKVTLSQKIQKLFTEDAKQLLMFYPSKMPGYDSNPAASSNNFRDSLIDEKFTDLVKEIAQGPLIKYWRQMQENKI